MDKTHDVSAKPKWHVIAALLLLVALFLWGLWVTAHMLEPRPPRIVKVQLAASISRFVEAEARRSDASSEMMEARTRAYLGAAEAALRDMGHNGRIVLVAEAVLAGSVPDHSKELEGRIARKLAGEQRAPQ